MTKESINLHVHPLTSQVPYCTCSSSGSNVGQEYLMSIVLNVHPGVQLYTRVDSKKSYCRSVTEGT